MSDFHQSGPVTALPRLVSRPIEDLEAEIARLTPKFPASLVIPMIPSEMERPALANIRDELCAVRYLDSLVISLNKATRDHYDATLRFFEPYGVDASSSLEDTPGKKNAERVRRFVSAAKE